MPLSTLIRLLIISLCFFVRGGAAAGNRTKSATFSMSLFLSVSPTSTYTDGNGSSTPTASPTQTPIETSSHSLPLSATVTFLRSPSDSAPRSSASPNPTHSDPNTLRPTPSGSRTVGRTSLSTTPSAAASASQSGFGSRSVSGAESDTAVGSRTATAGRPLTASTPSAALTRTATAVLSPTVTRAHSPSQSQAEASASVSEAGSTTHSGLQTRSRTAHQSRTGSLTVSPNSASFSFSDASMSPPQTLSAALSSTHARPPTATHTDTARGSASMSLLPSASRTVPESASGRTTSTRTLTRTLHIITATSALTPTHTASAATGSDSRSAVRSSTASPQATRSPLVSATRSHALTTTPSYTSTRPASVTVTPSPTPSSSRSITTSASLSMTETICWLPVPRSRQSLPFSAVVPADTMKTRGSFTLQTPGTELYIYFFLRHFSFPCALAAGRGKGPFGLAYHGLQACHAAAREDLATNTTYLDISFTPISGFSIDTLEVIGVTAVLPWCNTTRELQLGEVHIVPTAIPTAVSVLLSNAVIVATIATPAFAGPLQAIGALAYLRAGSDYQLRLENGQAPDDTAKWSAAAPTAVAAGPEGVLAVSLGIVGAFVACHLVAVVVVKRYTTSRLLFEAGGAMANSRLSDTQHLSSGNTRQYRWVDAMAAARFPSLSLAVATAFLVPIAAASSALIAAFATGAREASSAAVLVAAGIGTVAVLAAPAAFIIVAHQCAHRRLFLRDYSPVANKRQTLLWYGRALPRYGHDSGLSGKMMAFLVHRYRVVHAAAPGLPTVLPLVMFAIGLVPRSGEVSAFEESPTPAVIAVLSAAAVVAAGLAVLFGVWRPLRIAMYNGYTAAQCALLGLYFAISAALNASPAVAALRAMLVAVHVAVILVVLLHAAHAIWLLSMEQCALKDRESELVGDDTPVASYDAPRGPTVLATGTSRNFAETIAAALSPSTMHDSEFGRISGRTGLGGMRDAAEEEMLRKYRAMREAQAQRQATAADREEEAREQAELEALEAQIAAAAAKRSAPAAAKKRAVKGGRAATAAAAEGPLVEPLLLEDDDIEAVEMAPVRPRPPPKRPPLAKAPRGKPPAPLPDDLSLSDDDML